MKEWERIELTLPAYVGRKRNFELFNQIKLHAILIITVLFSWVYEQQQPQQRWRIHTKTAPIEFSPFDMYEK